MEKRQIKVVLNNTTTEKAMDTIKENIIGQELPYNEKNYRVLGISNDDDTITAELEGEDFDENMVLDVKYNDNDESFDVDLK